MSVLTAQQRCARDLLFFTAPGLWAFWPFLPLVRHRPDGAKPELGVLYDARGVSGRLGLSSTIFLTNLFLVPRDEERLLALPKIVYDLPEEMVADGWTLE